MCVSSVCARNTSYHFFGAQGCKGSAADVLEPRDTQQYPWGHLAGEEFPSSVLDMATGEELEPGMVRTPFIYKLPWPRDMLVTDLKLSPDFAVHLCMLIYVYTMLQFSTGC